MDYLLLFWKIKLVFSASVARRGRLWAVIKGQVGAGLFLRRHLSSFAQCLCICGCNHWSFPSPLHSACNTHCRSCDSQGSCTSCRDPSKVLLFGECQYETCAPQYYLDISTKTCRGKAFPGLCEDSFIQGCSFTPPHHRHFGQMFPTSCEDGNNDVCMCSFIHAFMHPLGKLFKFLHIAQHCIWRW